MSKKVIEMISKEEIDESLKYECFTLVLRHEMKVGGERVKIDKPIKAECIAPLGLSFRPTVYEKAEIVRALAEKLITANMRGETK